MIELQISRHLIHSSVCSGVFLPFLITSTSICGVIIVAVGLLAPFLAFLFSLHLKSLVPMSAPRADFVFDNKSLAEVSYLVKAWQRFAIDLALVYTMDKISTRS